jgi:hypothetical protein
MMTTINKRYSYPRVAVIQIDVYPAGGNPINTPHAFYARFVYGHRPYISRDLRRQPFASPHKDEKTPTPGRNLSDQRQIGPAVISIPLIPPPSRQPWSRGERFQPSGGIATSAYWAYNTSTRSVRSILARGGQPIGP